jgi:N-acetylglucosamine repressor
MRTLPSFSKTSLARETGITPTTMSKLFSDLLERGLIERDHTLSDRPGRPEDFYRIAAGPQTVAAVVVDIHDTRLVLTDMTGNPLPHSRAELPTAGPAPDFLKTLTRKLQQQIKNSGKPCVQVGVCIPGLVDQTTRKSVLCPNIHWIEHIALADQLAEGLGTPVLLMHEEQALLRCVQEKAGPSADHFILLDYSAGVGLSARMHGEKLLGSQGFAGEIGHITVERNGRLCGCGNRGCLETVAGDAAFLRRIQEATGQSVTLEEAVRRLKAQDPLTETALEETLTWQAIGLAAAINLFNPRQIFLNSGLTQCTPDYLARIRKKVAERALAPALTACEILIERGDKINGCIRLTLDRFFNEQILTARKSNKNTEPRKG